MFCTEGLIIKDSKSINKTPKRKPRPTGSVEGQSGGLGGWLPGVVGDFGFAVCFAAGVPQPADVGPHVGVRVAEQVLVDVALPLQGTQQSRGEVDTVRPHCILITNDFLGSSNDNSKTKTVPNEFNLEKEKIIH